jgi:hypothetical protein
VELSPRNPAGGVVGGPDGCAVCATRYSTLAARDHP